jgi:RimJ/RimL family protein N-acetyltransferase
MNDFNPQPIELDGAAVKLVPMTEDHAEGLLAAGENRAIWKYMPIKPPVTVDDYTLMIRGALKARDEEGDVPFTIIHKEDDKIVGSTRFIDVRKEHKGLEIGWTWLSTDYWQTAVNTECKYLLFCHAFDDLGAIRVQLKTDSRNERSQKAIQRIGGKREGTLRNHYILHDGYHRHTMMFSITHKEWKEVKPQLTLRLL